MLKELCFSSILLFRHKTFNIYIKHNCPSLALGILGGFLFLSEINLNSAGLTNGT